MQVKTKPRKSRKLGRKKGSHKRGYFWRKGRGCWCRQAGRSSPTLYKTDGLKLTDPDDHDAAQRAYLAWLDGEATPAKQAALPIKDVAQLYLSYCLKENAPSTYRTRANLLFDFCTGLPSGYREKPELTLAERKAAQIHPRYGQLEATELLPMHVEEWIAAHPKWGGSARMAKQAIKRCLGWAADSGRLGKGVASPLKGLKIGRSKTKVTYFTPEEEAWIYEHANPSLATLIRVCIRTGCRYGKEFAKLTKDHIAIEKSQSGERMTWQFEASESKTGKTTGKPRIIRITDPEIIAVAKAARTAHPAGPVFRSQNGQPWTEAAALRAWGRLTARLDIPFGPAAVKLTPAAVF